MNQIIKARVAVYSFFICVILVLFAVTATAETLKVDMTATFSAPATRTDGKALSIDEIGGFELQYNIAGADDWLSVVTTDNGATQLALSQPMTTTLADILDGTVAVQGRMLCWDTDNRKSEFTDIVIAEYTVPQSIIDALTPKPPGSPVNFELNINALILVE